MKRAFWVLLVVFFLVLARPGLAHAQIRNVRDGKIFIRSSGNSSVNISLTNHLWDQWDGRYLLKDPRGDLVWQKSLTPQSSSSSDNISLNQSGDYEFVPLLQFRRISIDSSSPLVIETNKRKATFRASSSNQTSDRYYFSVPSGTSNFQFSALVSRGSNNNSVRLMRPDGSTYTTIGVANNLSSWESRSISNPQSGYWSVQFSTESSDAEYSFWVEGIPNYFARSISAWFEPTFPSGSANAVANTTNIIGGRGLIGSGRVAESGSENSGVTNAFLDIGLEANEVSLNHTYREPSNDNSDPFNLNLSAFNFSNQAVDYTVNTLHAAPVVHLNGAAGWLASSDANLTNTTARNEWAEAVEAVVRYYNNDLGYGIDFMGILDEPNVDPLSASEFEALFETVASRNLGLDLYPGSVTTLDRSGMSYVEYLIDNLPSSSWGSMGVHPWQLGYPGYGSVYSTPVLKEQITSLMNRAGSGKKVLISEVNAKYGDHENQDETYFSSWEQSIWWSSLLTNVISTGKNSAVLYYPFSEDGTVHNLRAMVRSDGSMKPVAYATRFILDEIESNVFPVEIGGSIEVEALGTRSDNGSRVNILLTNKERRSQNISLNLQFASGSNRQVILKRIDEGQYNSSQNIQDSVEFVGTSYAKTVSMSPKSIYSLSIIPETGGGSTETCPGDTNNSNTVDIGDVAAVLYYWGQSCIDEDAACAADVNNDGVVNIGDIAAVLYYWGQSCL